MGNGGRRLSAALILALAAGLGVAVALPGGAAALRSNSGSCIALCPTVTQTATTTVTVAPSVPASISSIALTDITPISAQLQIVFNPGAKEASYSYSFGSSFEPSQYHGEGTTGTYNRVTITRTLDSLLPNTKYTLAVSLTPSNGPATATTRSMHTRLAPAFGIAVEPHAKAATYGSPLGITAILSGVADWDFGDLAVTQILGPKRKWYNSAPYSAAAQDVQIDDSDRLVLEADLTHNSEVRVALPGTNLQGQRWRVPTYSPPLAIQVNPRRHSSLVKLAGGQQRATYTLGVHPLAHYSAEDVYFYAGPKRSKHLTRFAAAPLRYSAAGGNPQLRASATLDNSAPLRVYECLKRRPVGDMGNPSSNKACGAATITR